MNPEGVELTLSGRTYELVFSLAAVDDICDALDCKINDIADKLRDSEAKDFRKNCMTILEILVNDAVDRHNEDLPDDKWDYVSGLRRRMTNVGFATAFDALIEAYIKGFISKAGEKDEDDISADPNPARAAG